MSTPTVLLLADSETEQLVARARRGGRRARRKLHRRLRAPLYPLAYAWSGHPWPATRAIRAAISAGLADGSRPYGSAVVAALHRHTSRLRDGQGVPERSSALRRAVLVLCDGNRLSRSAAASLLGLPTAAVAEHHRAGRAALGLPAEDSDVPRCAGWPLVSRDHAGLTPAERDAAKGHLRLCRRCRDGLVARRRTRAALQATGALSGSGAVAAAAVAIEGMLASAGTATVAGGIGVVGGLGIVGGVNGGHLPAPLPFGGSHHSAVSAASAVSVRGVASAQGVAKSASATSAHAAPTPTSPTSHRSPHAGAKTGRTPAPAQPNQSPQPTPKPTSTPRSDGSRSITLPSLPPITLPGVTVPPLPGLSGLPDLPLPSISLPPVTLPSISLPGVTLPLPSVSLPQLSKNGLSPTSLRVPLPTISLPNDTSH